MPIGTIELDLNGDEPIDFARAIIKYVMGKEYYSFEYNKNALAQIAGHIEVYLKYCEIEGSCK